MHKTLDQNKELHFIISEIAEVAEFLWQRGWAERNAGNISVNLSSIIDEKFDNTDDFEFTKLDKSYTELSGKYFFISGAGKRMRNMAKEPMKNAIIIKLNNEGSGYWIISKSKNSGLNIQPTSEMATHLAIHQMITINGSSDIVVMHAHTTELIALTQIKELCNEEILNNLLWGMHPECKLFVPKGIGFVPFTPSATENIAIATIKALTNHQVALWEKHGIFSISDSVNEAFDIIDILAKAAKIFLLTKAAGYSPEGLVLKG